MKKTTLLFLVLSLFFTFSSFVQAAPVTSSLKQMSTANLEFEKPVPFPTVSPQPIPTLTPKPTAKPIPFCGNQSVMAWPGNPVHLSGSGVACANGFGQITYSIKRGSVSLVGRGLVAVKGGELNTSGWDQKFEIGNWIVYVGQGKINVRGTDFQVVGYMQPRANTRAFGSGSASYHGFWKIRYGRLLSATAETIDKVDLPNQVLELAPVEAKQIAR